MTPKLNTSANRSVSHQRSSVPEFAVNNFENQDEVQYRIALDELLEVISDNSCDINKRINRVLDIGLTYFGLDNAIIASAMGDSLEVICVKGNIARELEIGDSLKLADTISEFVLNDDRVVAIDNIANDNNYNQCTDLNLGTHSYIGTQVLTENGPLGIVSFCSNVVRNSQFTDKEIKLIGYISSWLGSILGNEERIEFLSLQNNYYQSLFQTVPAMLMLCNQDGLIISTSNRLSAILGVDPMSVPGKLCQAFFQKTDEAPITAALKEGITQRLPLTMNCTEERTLEVEFSSSIKNIGSMQGVRMIVLNDVSERNQAIRESNKQNKQLALINESLNQFAYIASHDLQEPLLKIQQFSHFLEEDLGDSLNEDCQYYLRVIDSSATRMSTLIQDLLAFSSTAKDNLKVVAIDMNRLLQDVCSELELRIEESNASVVIEPLPNIAGDHTMVRQLFINLIGNSIKYRDTERDPEIRVMAEMLEGKLIINVEDNGIGFDQENSSKAFEPFNRLHTDSRFSGNGIGLSICSTVCEKHSWSLSVKSQPNQGSVFTINLEGTEQVMLGNCA